MFVVRYWKFEMTNDQAPMTKSFLYLPNQHPITNIYPMARRTNIVSEFVMFLKENKAYWMAPILIVFLLLGVLLALGATGLAPFIYTLF